MKSITIVLLLSVKQVSKKEARLSLFDLESGAMHHGAQNNFGNRREYKHALSWSLSSTSSMNLEAS